MPNNYINFNEFYKSSVLLSFVEIEGSYSIVFEKRSKNISQPGEICLPGGKFDSKLDLSTKDTAIRETHEELGIQVDKIKNVEYWGTYIAPMPTFIDVFTGVLETDDVYKLPIDKNEVEKLLVIPLSYFLNTKPIFYKIDNWSYPYRVNGDGDKDYIFPAEDLKLPERYHEEWNGLTRQTKFYPGLESPLWGVTADIIYRFIEDYKQNMRGD